MMEGERLVFMALSRPEKKLSLIFGGPFGPLIIAVDHNPERFTADQNVVRILSGKANKGESHSLTSNAYVVARNSEFLVHHENWDFD